MCSKCALHELRAAFYQPLLAVNYLLQNTANQKDMCKTSQKSAVMPHNLAVLLLPCVGLGMKV